MNGPEHYCEAERLIGIAQPDGPDVRDVAIIGLAQVHATLALAAATALSGVICNNVAPGHPINEVAHDAETITAVNEWHETAARPGDHR
ncbi:hypothetical protein KNU09_gp54 [Gordonia phage TillyBobJoe]|uniref:Uncharacterized protein n=1 Tax=Gordonia phage TillyBobJoe TaxID=2301560 RepID=A0A385DUR9_9CAUD|nr:hypothetical protein KNU09_gp54 [Gordonia phage TillyBobJoe]AXQ62285.1 hypothetical protein SEA_TILLYBOBJOE_54 [Gordonia phage TillyBobJoe]